MIKIYLKKIFQKLQLLHFFEMCKFYFFYLKNRQKNKQFRKTNPTITIPPNFYMYETYGLNYEGFFNGGKKTAQWIIENISQHTSLQNSNILDWGCGPGRILSHIPNYLDTSNSIYGSDYNKKYVNWCKENLENVTVKLNKLTPPLPFENNFFDAIYSVSIFTHLSREMHNKWFQELHRVSKKNAIVLISVHGKVFLNKLSSREKVSFNKGELIIHEYKNEGNRLFAAYQPNLFIKNLSTKYNFKILNHIEGKIVNQKPQQDIYILQTI